MSRALITLADQAVKLQAKSWIDRAPYGTRIEFRGPARTNDQNSMLWDLLTQVSVAVRWHGQRLSPEDWKILFMASLNQELRVVPNLDGTGFVPLGRSSSKLSVKEMSELIELIFAFCAEREVPLRQFIPQDNAA